MNHTNSESTSKASALHSTPSLPPTFSSRRILTGFLVVSITTAFATTVPAFQQADLRISVWARQQKFSGDFEKAIQLSEAFAHGSGVIAIFVILLWTDINNRRRIWNVATYVLVVGVLANVAKYFLPRLRPNSGVEITDIYATWLPVLTGIGRRSAELSFPSGHSATAVAMAIALTILYPRGKWLFITLACLAMWQRVYSSAHYPSDCLAGAGVALAIACLWRFTPAQTHTMGTEEQNQLPNNSR